MEPFKIGRYQVTEEIGRGGMATVYRAHDTHFDRDVAIKVLPHEFLHDPTFQTRFYREAKIIGSLEHVAIVPVHDFGEEEGQPYLVMRLMTGGSLEDKIRAGRISLAETERIVARIAPALDVAHTKGIVHRDLKPSNILFDQHDEPFLADFGIARLAHATALTSQFATVGTPAYMSPEQGRGDPDVDGRSDIYSLGAILFEMLSGRVPYESETPTGQIIKHINDPIPNILEVYPDLPPDCQVVIDRAMAKKKEDRYITVVEVAQALSSIRQGKPLPPAPVKPVVVDTLKAKVQPSQTLSPTANRSFWRRTPSGFLGRTPSGFLGRTPLGLWAGIGAFLLICLLAGIGWIAFPSVFHRPRPTPSFTPTIHLTETFTITPQPSATEAILVAAQPTTSIPDTLTPTSSPTLTPSATRTPIPTPTKTATPLPVAVVKVASANLRSGPGTNYTVLTSYTLGTELQVVGRNPEGTWLFILRPGQTQTGWIAMSTVDFKQDVMNLLLVKTPPPPTLKPVPTSTRPSGNPNPPPVTDTIPPYP